jgi:hypothetical protein
MIQLMGTDTEGSATRTGSRFGPLGMSPWFYLSTLVGCGDTLCPTFVNVPAGWRPTSPAMSI